MRFPAILHATLIETCGRRLCLASGQRTHTFQDLPVSLSEPKGGSWACIDHDTSIPSDSGKRYRSKNETRGFGFCLASFFDAEPGKCRCGYEAGIGGGMGFSLRGPKKDAGSTLIQNSPLRKTWHRPGWIESWPSTNPQRRGKLRPPRSFKATRCPSAEHPSRA